MMRTDTGVDFSLNRVAAMVRRYWYLLRSSWPRILDLIYWPAVQMLMWGFLQVYILQNARFFARACGFLCEPDSNQLGGRHFCRRALAAERSRRRKHGLDDHVSLSAADLRLL